MTTTLTATETLQKHITSGREVLIKKPDEKTEVYIRYNTTDIDGSLRWRIILNGNEFFVKEIIIGIPTRTISAISKGEKEEIKHHIYCQANEILFKDNIAKVS